MCVDMYTDICIDMCMDGACTHARECIDLCVGVCLGMLDILVIDVKVVPDAVAVSHTPTMEHPLGVLRYFALRHFALRYFALRCMYSRACVQQMLRPSRSCV